MFPQDKPLVPVPAVVAPQRFYNLQQFIQVAPFVPLLNQWYTLLTTPEQIKLHLASFMQQCVPPLGQNVQVQVTGNLFIDGFTVGAPSGSWFSAQIQYFGRLAPDFINAGEFVMSTAPAEFAGVTIAYRMTSVGAGQTIQAACIYELMT